MIYFGIKFKYNLNCRFYSKKSGKEVITYLLENSNSIRYKYYLNNFNNSSVFTRNAFKKDIIFFFENNTNAIKDIKNINDNFPTDLEILSKQELFDYSMKYKKFHNNLNCIVKDVDTYCKKIDTLENLKLMFPLFENIVLIKNYCADFLNYQFKKSGVDGEITYSNYYNKVQAYENKNNLVKLVNQHILFKNSDDKIFTLTSKSNIVINRENLKDKFDDYDRFEELMNIVAKYKPDLITKKGDLIYNCAFLNIKNNSSLFYGKHIPENSYCADIPLNVKLNNYEMGKVSLLENIKNATNIKDAMFGLHNVSSKLPSLSGLAAVEEKGNLNHGVLKKLFNEGMHFDLYFSGKETKGEFAYKILLRAYYDIT